VVTWPWIIRSDVVWVVRRNQEGEAREWMGGYKPGFELTAPGQEKQTHETSQDSLVCVFKRRGKHRCRRHFVLLKWSRGLQLNFCHAVSQILNLSSDRGFMGGSQIELSSSESRCSEIQNPPQKLAHHFTKQCYSRLQSQSKSWVIKRHQ